MKFKGIDPRLLLKYMRDNEPKNIQGFNSFSGIEHEDKLYPIFNLSIFYFFTSKDAEIINLENKKTVKPDIFEYEETYFQSFDEGVNYFKDFLQGIVTDKIQDTLHYNYFHSEINGIKKGWNFVRKMTPTIITHKKISHYGFYSGVLNSADNFIKKQPTVFESFYDCGVVNKFGIEPKPKPKPTVELKGFFRDGMDVDTIKAIQNKFKDYTGKRLAMLLHRLVALGWVTYLPHSKTNSRKHFVELLKDKKENMSYVNRILNDANKLKKHSTDDPDYINIVNMLSKTLKKQVV